MTITVKDVYRFPGKGNLKGFATVVAGPWTICGCRIIQQPGQHAYVALPQQEAADGRFFPVLRSDDTNLKNDIQEAVLKVWGGANTTQ